MVALPGWRSPAPNVTELNRLLVERANAEPARTYRGFSSTGRPTGELLVGRTEREPLDAYAARAVADGHHGEMVMAARLRMVPGVRLSTLDPTTGRQYEFSLLGGAFKGHCDGIVKGLLHDPETLHIWEHKSCNERKQGELDRLRDADQATALELWDAVSYAQAVLYMHASGVEKHYPTCSTPGERSTIAVITLSDPAFAEELIEKARRVLEAWEPP